MAHLEESTTILRFTRDWGLSRTFETTQSVTRLHANQISTAETESYYWEQLGCSDVSFIEDLNRSQTVWVAADSRIDATVRIIETTLTSVLRIRWTGPEDLLGAVSIVPEAVLGAVELERNWQRVKLYIIKKLFRLIISSFTIEK